MPTQLMLQRLSGLCPDFGVARSYSGPEVRFEEVCFGTAVAGIGPCE